MNTHKIRSNVMNTHKHEYWRAFATVLCFLWSGSLVAREDELAKRQPPAEKTAADSEPEGFIPFNPVRELWINLEGDLPSSILTKRMRVRVISGFGNNWLLPVYLPKEVSIDRPKEGGEATVTVKLLDCLSHPQVVAAIEKALKEKLAATFQPATPIGDNATMVVFLNHEDSKPFVIGTATCYRADGKLEHTLTFKVSEEEAVKLLANAKPEHVGVEYSESFLGRFITNDLKAAVTISKETTVAFKNQLSSNPNGARATFLVAIGGNVDQKVAFHERFRQQAKIEIARRQGVAENPALVEKVIDKLFEEVTTTDDEWRKRNDAVVTFLLSNGVRLTAALGDIKKMTDDQKTELKKKLESSEGWTKKDKHETKFGVKTEGGGWGISGKTDVDGSFLTDTEDTGSRCSKFNAEDLRHIQRAVEGNLPVAVLSSDQIQQMKSRSESELVVDISTFKMGRGALTNRLSFQAFAVAKTGRAKARAELLAKGLELEDAHKTALKKLVDATSKQKGQLEAVERLPQEIQGHIGVIPGNVELASQERWVAGVMRMVRDVWGFQPPGGTEKQIEIHMTDREPKNGPTRREKTQAAQKAVADNSAAITTKSSTLHESLAYSKSRNAEIAAACAEITRLQAEIDKVNKELADHLER